VALAREDDRQLTVLYPAADEQKLGKMRQAAESLLASMNIAARHRSLTGNRAADVIDGFNQASGRLLVIGIESPFLDLHAYDSLLYRLDAPLLLVR
jgi:hypothetical protein